VRERERERERERNEQLELEVREGGREDGNVRVYLAWRDVRLAGGGVTIVEDAFLF
jgi:hypothetical protein